VPGLVLVPFTTAHDDATTRATLEAIHAERVFIKPLDFEVLIAAIEDLLVVEEVRHGLVGSEDG